MLWLAADKQFSGLRRLALYLGYRGKCLDACCARRMIEWIVRAQERMQ